MTRRDVLGENDRVGRRAGSELEFWVACQEFFDDRFR